MRLTDDELQELRDGIASTDYGDCTISGRLLAELDATRAERDAAVRERDLLAGIVERQTHIDVTDEMSVGINCKFPRDWTKWFIDYEDGRQAGPYPTALDAIRAAMSNNTTK